MKSEINIGLEIERLIHYALKKKFIDNYGAFIARNSLFDLLKVQEAFEGGIPDAEELDINDILNQILQHCYEQELLPDATVAQRDLMAARIVGMVMPSPASVIKSFRSAYFVSPIEAMDYLYNLSVDVHYINEDRAKKNGFWDNEEPYGRLEFTNNFQECEKTQEEIEKRNQTEKPSYPACEICIENVGFSGNLWTPAKQNLRVVPLELNNKSFFLQFAQEQYYDGRFFVTGYKHESAPLSKSDYNVMLNFVENYPYCFISRDADLPELGNKFPNHNHYQGGSFFFPMDRAEVLAKFSHEIYAGVEASILNWPVSTIRIECDDADELAEIMNYVTTLWKKYSDEDSGICAFTETEFGKIPHNSASFMVRKSSYGSYEANISLRNNQKTQQFPFGVFAHGEEHRHIKGDNLGAIEIMGRGIFPGSFDSVLLHSMSHLMMGKKYEIGQRPILDKHHDWINSLVDKYGVVDNYNSAKAVINFEASRKFAKILEACGIFKLTEKGFEDFNVLMDSLGFIELQY